MHSLLLWLVNYSSLIQVTEKITPWDWLLVVVFVSEESMMSFISVVVGVVIVMLC